MLYCDIRRYHLVSGKAILYVDRIAMKYFFSCLGGVFGGVAAMIFQGYTLKLDVLFEKVGFEVFGALVINDVEGGRVYVVLYLGVKLVPGVFDGTNLMVFDG